MGCCSHEVHWPLVPGVAPLVLFLRHLRKQKAGAMWLGLWWGRGAFLLRNEAVRDLGRVPQRHEVACQARGEGVGPGGTREGRQ